MASDLGRAQELDWTAVDPGPLRAALRAESSPVLAEAESQPAFWRPER